MRRNFYFLLCTFFVFGCYKAKADSPPSFTGGHNQSLTICENSGITPINALMAITDADVGQTEYWFVVTGAAHGALAGSVSTFSTGGVVTPSGLSYTPATGYSGTDSFSIRITDGTFSDTTTVHVLINPLPSAITGTGSICLGLTSALSDAGGGTWASSSFIATVDPSSGVVTGAATGNATITYTLATGCKTTRVVTVNPMPNPITASAFSVCTGFSVGLIDAGGGAWSSVNTSVATINPVSGLLMGVGAGTVTISYVLATGCTTSAIVTVNQTPAPITGASSICLGAAITLGESVPGGVWSSSNTVIATVAGGSVTALTAGVVAIVYTLGTCTATKVLTVNAISPITGITSACVGGTFTLADATLGGMWSSAAPSVAAISTTGVVTGAGPGTTLVSYAMPSGCFTSASITINPLPGPITGITQMCVGATAALSDAGGGAWTSSSIAIATVNNTTGVVTGVATGAPTITYTLSTGCRTTIVVTINPFPSPISGILSVCAGFATSLIESGGGGAWSSSNTAIATVGATGYVSSILPGVTTITYAYPTGCSTSTNVTVNPTPAPITGASGVCQGDSTILSDALAGGVWSSPSPIISINAGTGMVRGLTGSLAPAGITYTVGSCAVTGAIIVNPITPITGDTSICAGTSATLTNTLPGTWSSSNTGIAAISSTGAVSGLSPGTSLITYTFPTGCFISRTFVVNPVPGPIDGVRAICIGASNPFSDSISGGAWSSSAYYIATIGSATGIGTGLATGVAIITYTLPAGCMVAESVTVNPLPSPISGPVYACQGLTMALGDAEGGGTWSSSDTTIATINLHTGFVNALSAGGASITYSLLGCIAVSEITINPLPPAIVGDSFVCSGLYDTLSDAGGGVWTTGNETVAYIDSATGILRGHALGSAYIIYTLPTGCKTMKLITVGGCNEAVNKVIAGSDINISPNPNKGDFMITGSLAATGGDVEVCLAITNMLGQVVYKNNVIARNGTIDEHIQPGNDLPGGIYILTLLSGNEHKAFHIVIQQ